MKKSTKFVICALVIALILSVSANAVGISGRWQRDIDRYEVKETSGTLVVDTSEGTLVLTFDGDYRFIEQTMFDEYGDLDDIEVFDYNDVDGSTVYEIAFYHN